MACYGRNRRKAGKSCKKKVNKNNRKRVYSKPKKIRPNKTKGRVRIKKPKRQTSYKEVEFQPKSTKRKRKVKLEQPNKLGQQPSVEVVEKPQVQNQEIVTEGVTPVTKKDGGYVEWDNGSYKGVYKEEALRNLRPDLFSAKADIGKQSKTNFGTNFPKIASKGEIYIRVDVLPNRVYKFDGSRWIEVNKNVSTAYLADANYIKYLTQKVQNKEYDLDLLSDEEKDLVEEELNKPN